MSCSQQYGSTVQCEKTDLRSLTKMEFSTEDFTENLYENLYTARGLSRRSIKWIIAM